MIEINLLPGARKKSPTRGPSLDLSTMFAGVSGRLKDKVLIGTVVASAMRRRSAAVGWMYFSQAEAQKTLDADTKKAHSDSVRFSTLFRENTRITATRDTLLRQLNLIKTIDQDRYIWPHVMDEVSRALPQYTWITSIVFFGTPQGLAAAVALPPAVKDTAAKKPSKPKRIETNIPPDPVMFRIMGNTVDIEALPRFMRDLEASPFLANVTLDLSAHGIDQGQDVTKFQLTVTYTRPDTAQLLSGSPLVMEGQAMAMALADQEEMQKLIVVGAVFVAAAVAFWYFQYSPNQDQMALNRARVDSLVALNTEIQKLSVNGSLQQYRDEADRFQKELAVMRHLVPSSNEVPTLLDDITSAARSAGLDISDVAPAGPVTPGDQFDVYRYSLGVGGPYHKVAEFLTNIGSMGRIVAPMNLSLVPGPPVLGDRRPKRNEVFVTATFQIQTYVAKASVPAPPAAPPGGM